MPSKYSYHVEITGDAPPFKWRCYRRGVGGLSNVEQKIAEGEDARSREDAIFDANAHARVAEHRRRWADTKETYDLFLSSDFEIEVTDA